MYYSSDRPLYRTAGEFMYKVYGWMATALLLSAGTAYAVFSSPALFTKIFTTPSIPLALMIAQFCLVVAFTGLLNRINFATALVMFLTYSILTGVTLSSIFIVYQAMSIYIVFFIAAAMFSLMALYGYYTKSDLTTMGNILIMILLGMMISFFINMFWRNNAFDFILSVVGVVVFTLLTAYDAQKIKNIGLSMYDDGYNGNKLALVGALTLYLDFVNLFLMLLRLMGKRRD